MLVVSTYIIKHVSRLFEPYKQLIIIRVAISKPCIASSRHSVSQGTVQKTAREKIKKARREEARERL